MTARTPSGSKNTALENHPHTPGRLAYVEQWDADHGDDLPVWLEVLIVRYALHIECPQRRAVQRAAPTGHTDHRPSTPPRQQQLKGIHVYACNIRCPLLPWRFWLHS